MLLRYIGYISIIIHNNDNYSYVKNSGERKSYKTIDWWNKISPTKKKKINVGLKLLIFAIGVNSCLNIIKGINPINEKYLISAILYPKPISDNSENQSWTNIINTMVEKQKTSINNIMIIKEIILQEIDPLRKTLNLLKNYGNDHEKQKIDENVLNLIKHKALGDFFIQFIHVVRANSKILSIFKKKIKENTSEMSNEDINKTINSFQKLFQENNLSDPLSKEIFYQLLNLNFTYGNNTGLSSTSNKTMNLHHLFFNQNESYAINNCFAILLGNYFVNKRDNTIKIYKLLLNHLLSSSPSLVQSMDIIDRKKTFMTKLKNSIKNIPYILFSI